MSSVNEKMLVNSLQTLVSSYLVRITCIISVKPSGIHGPAWILFGLSICLLKVVLCSIGSQLLPLIFNLGEAPERRSLCVVKCLRRSTQMESKSGQTGRPVQPTNSLGEITWQVPRHHYQSSPKSAPSSSSMSYCSYSSSFHSSFSPSSSFTVSSLSSPKSASSS